ncbi:MAG: molybdopterin-dependent oxidoreductase [Gemmatimonadaceae bacterium]|nr:molybdopterin-dependent oxidoreductase [Gemmatimonadaceae bacterium]
MAAVFGAGGSTGSYAEVEETDVVLLWGSNARNAHPIWFHHLLKGIRNHGTRLYVIDPRRSESAQWADAWLGNHVGSDIALANAMGREIIHAGLCSRDFIANACSGFEEYAKGVEEYTLERGEELTGVPADVIRECAHAYARAEKAMICWTLGITQHHDATEAVFALINLCLLTGHIGKWGSGLNPLRGQNNVQGGGDMGAIPNRLPGFQQITDPAVRERFEKHWGVKLQPNVGWNLTEMLDAMDRGKLTSLFVIGENPAHSDADANHVEHVLAKLDHLVVQEIYMTRTAELAHVVLPTVASWCEATGTVTNSERRVQLCRKAIEPPEGTRDELWIINEIGTRLGKDLGATGPEAMWNELRVLAPHMYEGMTYERLARYDGLQWPCPSADHPGTVFLHDRLWKKGAERGPAAPFNVVHHEGPVEKPDAEYPFTLTTGRHLDAYNTGIQTSGYSSPMTRGETLDISPEDADRIGITSGIRVRVASRRGSVVVPARIDEGLRPGVVFMTLHYPDDAVTNMLTINASDLAAGTAEFKACAVSVEPETSVSPARSALGAMPASA